MKQNLDNRKYNKPTAFLKEHIHIFQYSSQNYDQRLRSVRGVYSVNCSGAATAFEMTRYDKMTDDFIRNYSSKYELMKPYVRINNLILLLGYAKRNSVLQWLKITVNFYILTYSNHPYFTSQFKVHGSVTRFFVIFFMNWTHLGSW